MSRRALRASLALWRRRVMYRKAKVAKYERRRDGARIQKWRGLLADAQATVKRRELQLKVAKPMRLKAYDTARELIGVMEEGGNNQGPMVSRIIRANGGTGPEPWCGDFVAFCYRAAGSKAVQRSWASVRLLRVAAGVRKTSSPRAGDIVIFNFSHTGLFVRDLGGGKFESIEGNTGRSGAVSDSSTGGDGVYRKTRPKSLVVDYLRVTR